MTRTLSAMRADRVADDAIGAVMEDPRAQGTRGLPRARAGVPFTRRQPPPIWWPWDPISPPARRPPSSASRRTRCTYADEGVLPHRRTRGGHRRFLEADVLSLRAQRQRGEPPQATTCAAVWASAALEVLRAAEAGLGGDTPLGRPFGAAADELRRGLGKEPAES